MKSIYKTILLVCVFVFQLENSKAQLIETFANPTAVLNGSTGWHTNNLSNPHGPTDWFAGVPFVFNAQSGTDSSYVAANFDNTDSGGVISNWLITPELVLANGSVFSFYTRTDSFSASPDRMEVRYSTNSNSFNVGSTETSVGDFTNLVLTINDSLQVDSFPQGWTKFSYTMSGLPSATPGRFAFRYYVDSAGIGAVNSNFIGIDSVTYTGAVFSVPDLATSNQQLSAYPNVTSNNVNFSFTASLNNNASIKIYNSEGMLIAENIIGSNIDLTNINVQNFAAGKYLVVLSSAGKNYLTQFVKI